MIGFPGASPEAPTCSRAGCTAGAAWRIEWRNPRIHVDGRTKTWLACDEHVEFLREFLASRSFPLEVRPFEADRLESSTLEAGPATDPEAVR
ncbi:hypothetical protein ACDF64_13275 [Agromyces sp. MMS24-JH15]|uniref:hypothetical protein n=1 Tax=Agromyces sp. MMS24-JH15 TaxID=3243765 RepID=UPI0037483F5E